LIINTLEDKKGEDILLLDISAISDFTDYFVICSGTSDRMLKALADSVLEQVKKEAQLRGKLEGESHDGWLLIDYGGVVLHLFSPDRRDYYRLEDLWSEGKTLVHLQ
jgi:ribosome-associated protein